MTLVASYSPLQILMNVVQDYTTVMWTHSVQIFPEALSAIVGLGLKGMESNAHPYPQSQYQVSIVYTRIKLMFYTIIILLPLIWSIATACMHHDSFVSQHSVCYMYSNVLPLLSLSNLLDESLHNPVIPNECLDGTHDCDINAICTDTMSGFTCTCRTGYIGDGRVCVLPSKLRTCMYVCHQATIIEALQ